MLAALNQSDLRTPPRHDQCCEINRRNHFRPPPQVIARRRKEDCKVARVQKATDSSSLAEVVDRILDKGIVIDAWVKVSLVGIELLSIEARVVIASVETYLKYAEAIGLTASAATPA
jgi:gas vesicle structural protein